MELGFLLNITNTIQNINKQIEVGDIKEAKTELLLLERKLNKKVKEKIREVA